MQNTTATTTQSPEKPAALSRTWQATVTYRECGVVTAISTYNVTIKVNAQAEGGYSATINGQEAGVIDAGRILENARRENGLHVLEEVLAPLPTSPIGKVRAHKLHQIMGRLGLYDHYGIARRATGLETCYSLAALTDWQAHEVWAYLCNMFPQDAWEVSA